MYYSKHVFIGKKMVRTVFGNIIMEILLLHQKSFKVITKMSQHQRINASHTYADSLILKTEHYFLKMQKFILFYFAKMSFIKAQEQYILKMMTIVMLLLINFVHMKTKLHQKDNLLTSKVISTVQLSMDQFIKEEILHIMQ